MEFNDSVYWTCFILTSLSILLFLAEKRLFLTKNGSGIRNSAVNNADFVKFRRRFTYAYLTCLMGDYLQQPYLYYLLQSYGYFQRHIALLYVVYFLSNSIFNYLSVYLLQKLDRKILCCCFPALSSLACLLKFSSNYNSLVLSRILDGACLSLISAPFQEWYAKEHLIDFDFPKDWIPETFRLVGTVSKFLAVASDYSTSESGPKSVCFKNVNEDSSNVTIHHGFVAELVEDVFKITLFPFLLAIPLFVAAGTWMCFTWPNSFPPDSNPTLPQPNYITSNGPGFFARVNSSRKLVYQNPNVLLLCIYHTLLDTCQNLVYFVWTPIFVHLNRVYRVRPAFGGLYSAFAASLLLGYMTSRLAASRKFSYCTILTMASSLAAIGSFLASSSSYPDHETKVRSQFTMYGICVANVGLGMFGSSFQAAHKDLVPFEQRYHSLALFKSPVHILSSLLLVTTSLSDVFFNWLLTLLCALFTVLSLITSLALHGTVKKQQASAVDHVTFEIKGGESYDIQ